MNLNNLVKKWVIISTFLISQEVSQLKANTINSVDKYIQNGVSLDEVFGDKKSNNSTNQNTIIDISNKKFEIIETDNKIFSPKNISKNIDISKIEDIDFQKNIKFAWIQEVEFFIEYFKIDKNNPDFPTLFKEKVKELQTNLKFSKKDTDWCLWDNTMTQIYLNHYIPNYSKITNLDIKTRIDTFKEMQWYKNVKWALYKWLNVFKYMTYYWKDTQTHLEWTYINTELSWVVPEKLDTNESKIIVSTINWKAVLAFYVEWNLYTLTYVSPGLWNFTPRKYYKSWSLAPNMYRTSGSYPEAKNWKPKWWAVMPYAFHIDGWILGHWSDGTINWEKQSHWCIRIPLYYVRWIYYKLQEIWYKNVAIDLRWLK